MIMTLCWIFELLVLTLNKELLKGCLTHWIKATDNHCGITLVCTRMRRMQGVEGQYRG